MKRTLIHKLTFTQPDDRPVWKQVVSGLAIAALVVLCGPIVLGMVTIFMFFVVVLAHLVLTQSTLDGWLFVGKVVGSVAAFILAIGVATAVYGWMHEDEEEWEL